jgi:hypothetical protein
MQRPGTLLAAGMCWLAAGVLSIVATFAPLYRYTISFEGEPSYGYAPSGWAWNIFGPTAGIDVTRLGSATPYGIPIVIAGVVLLVAGALAFRAASNLTGYLATGLLIGQASILAVENFSRAAVPRPEGATWEVALGTWLLIAAAALAIVGAMFAAARATPVMTQAWVEAPPPGFGVPAQQPVTPEPGQVNQTPSGAGPNNHAPPNNNAPPAPNRQEDQGQRRGDERPQ